MNIAQIKQLVSQHTGVSVGAMDDRRLLSNRVRLARWLVYWLATRGAKKTYVEIADGIFGGQHDSGTQIRQGLNSFLNYYSRDWDLRNLADHLLKEVQPVTKVRPYSFDEKPKPTPEYTWGKVFEDAKVIPMKPIWKPHAPSMPWKGKESLAE